MNDWEINKFLKAIFALQISVLGLVLLDNLGIYVPILREIIPVIYLLFVPGILILRITKIHNLGSVETILYSVGLSITSIMFIGFSINLFYPLLKISNPISLVPLIVTMTIFVGFLSILSYLRDKNFSGPSFIDIKYLISPIVLFLFLFPFLAIFGTYLMNWYKINIFLMLLIILICMTLLLFAYGKIPKKYYPLTIFIMAISLLFHTSLISNYVTGYDIQVEYYSADVVIKNAFWNFKIYSLVNTMPSVTLLGPIFSIISKISLDWVFKIIYPFIFSLVPLGLYKIVKKQTNEEIAFLSCFLFISFFVFYTQMFALARQEIAELFLVLSILLIITKKMGNSKRYFLFIIFGISLIISHYSICYFYLFSLIIIYMLVLLSDRYDIQKIIDFISPNKHKKDKLKNNVNSNKENISNKKISSISLIFFLVFTIAWYKYVNSKPLDVILYLVLYIKNKISCNFINFNPTILISLQNQSQFALDSLRSPNTFQGLSNLQAQLQSQVQGVCNTDTNKSIFLNPSTTQGLYLLQFHFKSSLHIFGKYVHLITQFFMVIGFFAILLKRIRMNFNKEYLAFILISFVTLLAALTVPYFSNALNTERLYHITLIFLSPVAIIGGITVLKIISKFIPLFKGSDFYNTSLKLISIFLIFYLLFNIGFLYNVFNDDSTSISLNKTIDYAIYNQKEIIGAQWITDHNVNGLFITDDYRAPLTGRFQLPAYTFSEILSKYSHTKNYKKIIYNKNYENLYLLFGTRNIINNSVLIIEKQGVNIINKEYITLNNLFSLNNKIYDNDGYQVYELVKF